MLSSTYTNNRSYVNMFLCIGICRHRMRTHIHIHASIHISIDIHIYICMHTHIRTCRYVHVCLLHLAHTNNRLKEGASPMHLWHANHAVHVYAFPMHLCDDNLPQLCQCHVISWINAAKGWHSLLALALTLWLWHRALLRAAFIQCSIIAFWWSFGPCNLWHEYLLVSLLHGFGGLADPLAQWPIVHSESSATPTSTEMAKEMTV